MGDQTLSTGAPDDAPDSFCRLAEADGATLGRSAAGAWYARDKGGAYVVKGCLSRLEAARAYCELAVGRC